MALSLKHAFNSAKSDGSDGTRVQPSNWNAEHTILMATARVLGRKTGGSGAVEELTSDDIWDLLGWVGTTRTVFQQSAVPTGWTKDTTHNNKAFRLVSGSVSSGGTNPFTTALVSAIASASYTLTATDMPAHTHGAGSFAVGTSITNGSGIVNNVDSDKSSGAGGGGGDVVTDIHATEVNLSLASGAVSGTSASAGSGGGHAHNVTLAVQYVDFVVGEKD